MNNIPNPGTVTPTNADGCPTVIVLRYPAKAEFKFVDSQRCSASYNQSSNGFTPRQ